MQFLFEKRTEPYMEYGEGVPEKKIVYGAKNTSSSQAWLELDWCDAGCGKEIFKRCHERSFLRR
jgi:hypothetical protein